MTKQHIINKTALLTGQTKAQTEETINAVISLIKQAVSSGITVSIQGFISLTPVTKKAIEGEINGTHYSKPERKGIKLKAGKPFKDLVENGIAEAQDEK